MLPSFKLFRKKWIIISVVTILVITFGYAINARYYYPKLNNDAVQLFIKDKRRIPEQNNSVYSIIGFNAPDNIHDIHVFGLNLVNETLN